MRNKKGFNIIDTIRNPIKQQECAICTGSVLVKMNDVYRCKVCGSTYNDKDLRMNVGLQPRHSNRNKLRVVTPTKTKIYTDQHGNPLPNDDQVIMDDLAAGRTIVEYHSTEFD